MKIRYNIADQKKISYVKFFFITLILLVVSLVLIVAGVSRLSANAKQFRNDREKLQALKDKNDSIKKRESQQNIEMAKTKSKWGKKLLFLNRLIDDKIFSYLDKLDKLEKLLPEGVFVQSINLNPKSNERIQMTIAAVSYQKLLESYKVFFRYNMVVQNQSEANGLFEASIIIRLKNETKTK